MVISFLKAQLLMFQWFILGRENHYKVKLGFFNSYLGHSCFKKMIQGLSGKLGLVKGSMVGLAVGDALGAPVEFDSLAEIKRKFGEKEIDDLKAWGEFPAGSYTDDTQMSLATAAGIIKAFREGARAANRRGALINYVYDEYLRWHETQHVLHEWRSPGNTCLASLGSGRMGTVDNPINKSKGCGGVMRTAPVGLVFKGREAFEIAMDCAAITHGHPSGYLTAGFLAEMVCRLIEGETLRKSMETAMTSLRMFRGHEETLGMLNKAIELAGGKQAVIEAIPMIGEGWVGDEALAIALLCALRFEKDFRKGVVAAVNHGGDSDSTGSIAGAILGARLGLRGIPRNWVERVENRDKILRIADKLADIRAHISEGSKS
jgi:ADP-ribosylglycohydrolase